MPRQRACSLRVYGGEALPTRTLRGYIAAKIAATWTGEPGAAGELLPQEPAAQQMLTEVEPDPPTLQPLDPMHRRLSLTILNQFEQLMRMRWKMIEEARNSV